jgi:hypothetical protein
MNGHLRYLSYVVRHKWFVLLAGLQTGAPLWRLVIHDWSKFLPSEWFAYVEKFHGPRREEWIKKRFLELLRPWQGQPSDYAQRHAEYEWPAEVARRDAAFNVAWLKHQHRNPHHWQHWLLAEDNPSKRLETPQSSGTPRAFPLPMPDHFVREMVADWMGAGRAITGTWEAGSWYERNRDNVVVDSETRRKVEVLLVLHAGLGR